MTERINTPITRRQALVVAAGTAAAVALPAARAQSSWPSKPVRFLVPFAPGGTSEIVARSVAAELTKQLGVSVFVENKPGGAGVTAMQEAQKSAPDGHTLLLVAAPFTTVPAVLPQAGYDPVQGFTPISMVAEGPLLWVCNKDLPVANLRELVEYARTRPGQLNYGSAGAGGINHLVLETLKARSGTFITHIPYRGIAPATLDMISGQIQLVTGTIPALAPFVRDGRVKALAVSTAKRSPALPEFKHPGRNPGLHQKTHQRGKKTNYAGQEAGKRQAQALVIQRFAQKQDDDGQANADRAQRQQSNAAIGQQPPGTQIHQLAPVRRCLLAIALRLQPPLDGPRPVHDARQPARDRANHAGHGGEQENRGDGELNSVGDGVGV